MQTQIYQHYADLEKLIHISLSLAPNNKRQSLKLDNLKQQTGRIQNTIIRNDNKIVVDCGQNARRSCVMLKNDNVVEEYNIKTVEEKKIEFIKLHDKAQSIIGKIVDELKDLVKKYPNKYQAQLAVEAGLTKELLKDNNFTIMTFFDMMAEQGIITKNKFGNNAYFSIKNDISYTPFKYVQSTGYASKLEATAAQYLLDNKFDFRQQVKLTDLGLLRIDFEVNVDDTLLYVEINGRQHYERVPYFHKTEGAFISQQKRDLRKKQYFRDKELNFLEIKYDQNIEQVLKRKIFDIRNSNV